MLVLIWLIILNLSSLIIHILVKLFLYILNYFLINIIYSFIEFLYILANMRVRHARVYEKYLKCNGNINMDFKHISH
jgi:hypothetical protein